MRPDDFILSEWVNFQKRMESIHGAPLPEAEATAVITELLAAHKKDMLMQMVRTWLPCDLISLSRAVKGSTKATERPAARKASKLDLADI